LARALFSRPELLILDEPASGLDLPSRELLLAAIEAVGADGHVPTTILATHHLEEVPPSATHAALLRAGALVAAGPVEGMLTPELLKAAFGIAVEVGRRPGGRWWATAGEAPVGEPG
jgi:iron complex transport system ATP-binding protein